MSLGSTDLHVFLTVAGVGSHWGGQILRPGTIAVLLNALPTARASQMCACVDPLDSIAMISFTVLTG
jgi:hypothetical protein